MKKVDGRTARKRAGSTTGSWSRICNFVGDAHSCSTSGEGGGIRFRFWAIVSEAPVSEAPGETGSASGIHSVSISVGNVSAELLEGVAAVRALEVNMANSPPEEALVVGTREVAVVVEGVAVT